MGTFRETVEMAEEILTEEFLKVEYPSWIRDFKDDSQIEEHVESYLSGMNASEKLDQASLFLKDYLKKNRYRTEMSRKIDEEWLAEMERCLQFEVVK